jgi:hypothetical protein
MRVVVRLPSSRVKVGLLQTAKANQLWGFDDKPG